MKSPALISTNSASTSAFWGKTVRVSVAGLAAAAGGGISGQEYLRALFSYQGGLCWQAHACIANTGPASRILVLIVTCCCRHCPPTLPLPGSVGSWIETGTDAMDALRMDGSINSGGCIASLACGVAHSALQLGLLQVTRRSGVGAGCFANHSPCFLVSHESLRRWFKYPLEGPCGLLTPFRKVTRPWRCPSPWQLTGHACSQQGQSQRSCAVVESLTFEGPASAGVSDLS